MFFEPLLLEVGTIIYVSEKGIDSGTGTKDDPINSLQKALDLVKNKTLFVIDSGTYSLTSLPNNGQLIFYGNAEKTRVKVKSGFPDQDILMLMNLVLETDGGNYRSKYLELKDVAVIGTGVFEAYGGSLVRVSAGQEITFKQFVGKQLYGSFKELKSAEDSTINITWTDTTAYKSDFVSLRGCLFPEPVPNTLITPQIFRINGKIAKLFISQVFANVTVSASQTNKLKAKLTVKATGQDTSSMFGQLCIVKDEKNWILSALKVNPHNRVVAKYTGIEPPKRTVYGTLIQDAFTIENSPTVNTGDAAKIIFDPTTETFLQWKFSSNTDDFYDSTNETAAFLEINISKTTTYPSEITVSTTTNAWQEFGITHENKPQAEEYSRFNLPKNFWGKVVIPLGGLLKPTDKSKPFLISLTLKSTAETEAWSKEGQVELAARLYYQYSYYPPTLTYRRLDCKITVQNSATSKIQGLVFADSNWIHKGINGRILVPKFDRSKIIGAALVVAQNGKTNFKGKVGVPRFLRSSQIAATLEVALGNRAILKGKVLVPQENQKSAMSGKITIQVDGISRISGEVKTPKFDSSTTLPGNIYVVEEHTNSLIAKLTIPKFDRLTKLSGTIRVPAAQFSQIAATLTIDKETPTNLPKLSATIKVLAVDYTILKGKVYVTPNKPRQYVFTTN